MALYSALSFFPDYILVTRISISNFLGSKKSLADAVEKGVDLRDRILKLYHDSYYGGSMKLVVIGGGKLSHFVLH